jgi:hypothetical protein
MAEQHTRWVARLTPTRGSDVEMLLSMPLGLDVWERSPDQLVVAASEHQLAELERRGLAEVERLYTVADFLQRAQNSTDRQGTDKEHRDEPDS